MKSLQELFELAIPASLVNLHAETQLINSITNKKPAHRGKDDAYLDAKVGAGKASTQNQIKRYF